MTPITKHESRKRNDMRAHSRYSKRKDIDRWHEHKRLERELKEPVS